MSDLISRQDVVYALTEANLKSRMDSMEGGQENRSAIRIIMELPSAECNRGEWIQHVNEPSLWSCSICETVIYSEHEEDRLKFHKWCGCCGADMRGRREDDKERSDFRVDKVQKNA